MWLILSDLEIVLFQGHCWIDGELHPPGSHQSCHSVIDCQSCECWCGTHGETMQRCKEAYFSLKLKLHCRYVIRYVDERNPPPSAGFLHSLHRQDTNHDDHNSHAHFSQYPTSIKHIGHEHIEHILCCGNTFFVLICR